MFGELGLIGGVVETAAGCVARPRRSLFVHRGGDPEGLGVQAVDLGGRPRVAVQPAELGDRGAVDAAEHDLLSPADLIARVVGFGTEDRNDEESGTGRRARDLGHDLQHLVVGRMKVVEDEEDRCTGRPVGQAPGDARSEALTRHRGRLRLEQRRSGRAQRLVEQRPRRAVRRVAPRVAGDRTGSVCFGRRARRRGGSCRCPRVRPRPRTPIAWLRAPSHAARKRVELLVATDQRGTGDVEGGGKRHDRLATGGAAEPMVVLGEDRLLEVAQCRPRFDAELLCEHPARTLVGTERVGLPARSVQGDHELSPQPFAERLADEHALELGDQLARLPEGQERVEPVLDHVAAQLLERAGRGCAALDVLEAVIGLGAPQRERVVERRHGRPRIAALEQSLEPLRQGR